MKLAKLVGMILAVVLVLSMALVACAPEEEVTTPTAPAAPAAPAEPVTLKLVVHCPSSDTITYNIIDMFVDLVKERSNGELVIDFLGGPEIHPAKTLNQFTADGMTDMMMAPNVYYPGEWPEGTAITFLTSDNHRTWTTQNKELFDLYDETLQKRLSLKFIGAAALGGGTHPWSTDAAPLIDADWTGCKARVPGATQGEIAIGLGASPVTVPYPEVPQALERGVIDAYIGPTLPFYDSKLYEYCPNLLNVEVDSSGPYFYMNLDSWNNLGANLQGTLMDVMREHEAIAYDYRVGQNEKVIKEMVEQHGLKVHEMPASDWPTYRAVLKKVWTEFVAPQLLPGYAEKFENLMAGHTYWD